MSSTAEDAFNWYLTKTTTLPPPQRHLQLVNGRKWEFDFVWPAEKIIFEVEGGIWRRGGGAHSRPINIIRDIEKYNAAALLGFRVFRVTPDMIKSGEARELAIKILGAD